MLPADDAAFLTDRYPDHSVLGDGRMICVLIPGWPLPAGYSDDSIDLLLRLAPGYPDVAPDMWWMDPAVSLLSGAPIAAADQREPYLGRVWQRWSRHLPAGAWNTGIDCLQTYLAQVRTELERTALAVA